VAKGRPCAVERAYELMSGIDQLTFMLLIENTDLSAGTVAAILREYGYADVDRMAVGHFRRKLEAGKATL